MPFDRGLSTDLRTALGVAMCLGLNLLALGCSEGRHSALVSGTVTLDGQPASEVQVSFQPQVVDTAQPHADAMGSFAVTDAEGKFTLLFADSGEPGALIGIHTVRLTDKRASSTSDGGPSQGPKPRFPARYADGATTFEVVAAGTDQANFALKSK